VVLLNGLLHLYLTLDPQQTTNLMLLVVGVGVFFLSALWFGLVMAATLAGWVFIARLAGFSPAWVHFGFGLFMAAGLALIVQMVRIRTLRRLESLRLQAEHNEAARELRDDHLRSGFERLESSAELVPVKQLQSFLPICSCRRNVHNRREYWRQAEDHSQAQFNRGICPDCYARFVKADPDRLNNRKTGPES
jgi:hypothetical protein